MGYFSGRKKPKVAHMFPPLTYCAALCVGKWCRCRVVQQAPSLSMLPVKLRVVEAV